MPTDRLFSRSRKYVRRAALPAEDRASIVGKPVFKIEPETGVRPRRVRASDTADGQIERDADGIFNGFSVQNRAEKRGGKNISRAVEHPVHVLGKGVAFLPRFRVEIRRAESSFFKRNARYNAGPGSEKSEFAKYVGNIFHAVAVAAVFGPRQKTRFGQVRGQDMRTAAEFFHFFGERGPIRGVKPAVVAHDGIGEDQRVAVGEHIYDPADEIGLALRAEKTRVKSVDFQPERLPMPGDREHFFGQVEIGVSLKTARVGR